MKKDSTCGGARVVSFREQDQQVLVSSSSLSLVRQLSLSAGLERPRGLLGHASGAKNGVLKATLHAVQLFGALLRSTLQKQALCHHDPETSAEPLAETWSSERMTAGLPQVSAPICVSNGKDFARIHRGLVSEEDSPDHKNRAATDEFKKG